MRCSSQRENIFLLLYITQNVSFSTLFAAQTDEINLCDTFISLLTARVPPSNIFTKDVHSHCIFPRKPKFSYTPFPMDVTQEGKQSAFALAVTSGYCYNVVLVLMWWAESNKNLSFGTKLKALVSQNCLNWLNCEVVLTAVLNIV